MDDGAWHRVEASRWYGDIAGVAAPDLADAGGLDAVAGAVDEDVVALLRASRIPRVRPVLVVLAARASGGGAVDAELQYAAELLYTALLVHDVALGRPGGRRRRLARKVARSGLSLLGGNRMLLRAMELARHVPAPEVLDDLIDTLSAFQDGQELAEALRDGVDGAIPDEDAWGEHADGHTGALFAFCCRAGAQVTACRAAEVSALGRYGRHLGRLWHAAEDIVLLQQPDAAAHLAGRAAIGRPMLPVAVAVGRDPGVAQAWRAVGHHGQVADAEALLARLHTVRAIAGARERVAREHWLARQALGRFEETPHRRALERLASGLARAPFEDAASAGPALPPPLLVDRSDRSTD